MLTSFYQLKKLNNQFRWTLYLNSLPSQNYLLTSFLYQSNRDMSLCAKHTDANAGRTGYNIIRVYEFTCMCEYSECSHRFTVMPSSQHGVCVCVCACVLVTTPSQQCDWRRSVTVQSPHDERMQVHATLQSLAVLHNMSVFTSRRAGRAS